MVQHSTVAGAYNITGMTSNGYIYKYMSLGKLLRLSGTLNDKVLIADRHGDLHVLVADSEAVVIIRVAH